MTKYRGYYIDHVVFNSKKEIDEFCKNELIAGIKEYTKMMFSSRYSASEKLTLSQWVSDREKQLHEEFGRSGEEIEELEIVCEGGVRYVRVQ